MNNICLYARLHLLIIVGYYTPSESSFVNSPPSLHTSHSMHRCSDCGAAKWVSQFTAFEYNQLLRENSVEP